MINGRRLAVIIVSAMAAAAALFICLPLLPSLVAQQAESGRIIWHSNGNPESFTIAFTHSANKGYVAESYRRLPDGSFTLETGIFESYGAGMLEQLPEGVVMEDMGDHLLLRFPQNPMNELSVIPGEIAGHQLSCDDESLELGKVSPYKRVIISWRRLSLMERIFTNLPKGR